MIATVLVRFDRAGTKLARSGARTFHGVAARVHGPGDGLAYPTGPEYRDDSSLDTLTKQLVDKPVTWMHADGLIREGAAARVIGKVTSAKVERGRAHVDFEVTDDAAARMIDDGQARELSVGYSCELDGARYQRDIKVDHLAVVPRARCGPACRIDGAQGCDQGCACNSCATGHTSLDTTMDPASVNTQPSQLHLMGSSTTSGIAPAVVSEDSVLTAHARHQIPAGHFAVPGRKALPLEDANHVRDAMARFSQEKFENTAERRAAYHHILARAHELGVDPSGFKAKHADDDDMPSEGESTSLTQDGKMTTNADNAPGGGQGIAQNQLVQDFSAPQLHAKISAALQGMPDAQSAAKAMYDGYTALKSQYDELKGKYDAITMAQQTAAEKARDQGSLTAMEFQKKADSEKERADRAERERDEHKAKLDAAKKDLELSQGAVKAASERADKAEADAKAAQAKRNLDQETEHQAGVAARAELLTKVSAVLGYADRSKKTDREVMCDVIKDVHDFDVDAKASMDYVRARFDAALERVLDVAKSREGFRKSLNEMRRDADERAAAGLETEQQAQTEMATRASTAWVTKK